MAGETLEFDIVYKNVSGQPITICTYPDNFYVWTQLWVVDSSGTDVARGQHGNGIRRPMNVSDFVTLQPGQTASVREKIAGHRKGKPRLKAGKYAAKVSISGINRMEKYVPNFDGFCKKHNIKPWTGVIKSGPAAFMVIPMPEIQWGEEAEGLHVGIGEPEVKDGSIKVPAFLRNKRSDDKKHFDGADYQIILNNKLYLSYQWPALNGRQVTVYPEQVRGPFWIDLSDYVNESNRDQSYQADRPLKQLPKGKYNLRVIYVGRNGKPRISSPEINVTIPDDSSWGESVEGLQVWLRTDKMVWRMGETPTFSLDLRNNGKKVFNYVRIMEAHCRIEYDGQWYIWADPIMISAPTWPLRPGIQVNGAIKVKLVKSWGIKMGGKERLELTPGRHMVRVRFTPGGGEVQAVSNPVEIEILAVGVKPAIMEGVKQIDVLSWGEAVEGVQCRLRADKQIWKTNETVTFKADIRNQGNKRWGIGPERWKRKFCEVEFDGAWHSWPYPASVHLPDGVLQENHQFNDVLIPLDERLGGVNVTPGRHVVRVAFFREPVNPANRVVSKPVEIEILPTEKSDVQVEGGKKREGQSPKDVILPDVDTKALMLDLATGELVDTPKVRGKIALWTAIERFGKGDLVYDAKALTLVRGATTQAATEKIVGPFKAYRISQTLPEVLIIKTKEGREYVVKIFSADKESCRLEYYLQTTPDVQVEGEGSKGQGKLRDQEEPTYAGRSLTELIAALSDQDFQTRINAVYHLGYMGQKAKPAVPALVDALNQKPLRESVLHSLGNIGVGAEDAIPALMKAIAEYPSTCRWKAAVALANIGEGSVASLEEGAKSEKMYLRIWCNAALAKQKESDSPNLRYLAKAMKRSDRSTAVEAVRALTMLGPISKPLVPDFIEALKQSNVPEKDVAFALAQIGQDAKAAVPELVKMIQSTNPSTQRDAIYALSAIGGEDAAPAVASLIQALASKDKLVRREAANALGNIGLPASTAIEQLANILKDEDEFVRQNAAQALGKIDLTNLEPVPALIVAMKDKSFRVRRAAGTTLLRIGPANKDIIFAFIRVAQDNWKYFKTIGREYIGPSNTLIQSCERFFGLLGPRQSYIVPDLIEMLRSSEKQSHLPAIWALGRIGKAAKPAVPYILESMKNPDLQERALEALRKISPQAKAAVPGLVKMLEDKHKRFSAAAALEGIGPAAYEAIPALQNHLGYSGVTFARALLAIDPKSSKAIEALVKIAESPYVPNQWTEQPDAHYLLVKYGHDKDRHLQGLIDALENPNSRIRLSAAAYLGKLGAEANEAAESLGRALKDDDPEVRAEAARAILLISLRASERKEACNTIAALLAGKDFTSLDGLFMAQVRAAGALTSFGPLEEWAVRLLIAKVQDDSIRTRVAAIKAFGNIGPGAKEAIPYLKRLLKAENWQIRQSAAQAIEKIDNKTDVQVEAKSLSSRLKDRWLLEAKQSIDAHNTGRFGIYFGIKYVGIPELSQMPDEDIVISHRVKSLKMGDIPIDMNDLVGEVSIRNKTGFGRFFLPEQIEGLENLKPGKYPVTLLLEGHIYEAKRPDKILGQWRVELEEEIKLSDMFLRDAISWITWGERRGTNIHSRCAQSWPA
ncbi:MAG: HEAT repeat domain-containing protein [Planctomycetota bacterium]